MGNVTGSASRIAPAAPPRSGIPVSAPVPSSTSSTAAWNTVATPSPRFAAHTDTAAPVSISRPWPITPPAPQPTSSPGASTSWIDSSTSCGSLRNAPETNTSARSQSSPPSSSAAAAAAAKAAARGSGVVDKPVPMRTAMTE